MQKILATLILFLLLSNCGSGNSSQDLMQRAEQYLSSNDFNSAITLLNTVNPPTEQSISLLAEAYAGLGGFRVLQLYDQVVNYNTIEPQFLILFKLSFVYTSDAVLALRNGLSLVDTAFPNFDQRSDDTNIKYALMSFYNASQILLHDSDLHMQGTYASDWNPCLESDFPMSDIKNLIIDLDRGIGALEQVAVNNSIDAQSLFYVVKKIQNEASINSFLYDPNSVENTDVSNLRDYLNQILYGNPACETR